VNSFGRVVAKTGQGDPRALAIGDSMERRKERKSKHRNRKEEERKGSQPVVVAVTGLPSRNIVIWLSARLIRIRCCSLVSFGGANTGKSKFEKKKG